LKEYLGVSFLPAEKPKYVVDVIDVAYDENHWFLLRSMQDKAISLMEVLAKHKLRNMVHGSLARGDVSSTSDIDVIVPYEVSSFIVETALGHIGYDSFYSRMIVQATPKSVLKAHIYLEPEVSVSFPLMKMTELEYEFYKFGGALELEELRERKRVPGVDKRLILIEPTETGHRESSVVGKESVVAKKLSVSLSIVKERVRVLTRRDRVGRTGVYFKRELAPSESYEEVFNEILARDPAIKRRLKKYGK
jgi:predicted nucleotidyltransferase